jgi:hypothetical protein
LSVNQARITQIKPVERNVDAFQKPQELELHSPYQSGPEENLTRASNQASEKSEPKEREREREMMGVTADDV